MIFSATQCVSAQNAQIHQSLCVIVLLETDADGCEVNAWIATSCSSKSEGAAAALLEEPWGGGVFNAGIFFGEIPFLPNEGGGLKRRYQGRPKVCGNESEGDP